MFCSFDRPKATATAHARAFASGAGKSPSFPPLPPSRARASAGRTDGRRGRSQPGLPPRARQVSAAPIGCRGGAAAMAETALGAPFVVVPSLPPPLRPPSQTHPFLTKESSFQFRVVIRVIRLEEKRRVARARREGEGEDSQRAQR